MAMLAQVAPPASQDAQQKEKAQALLREGSALYKQADFAGALQKFEAAYAVFPSPKLQFNIGQANRELGRPVEAVTAFDWFVTDAFDASPELLAEARQSSADLKARLGRLRVDCSVPAAHVNVDGKYVGVTPLSRTVWAMPGPHRVAVSHSGYLPATIDVTVAAGEVRSVSATLRLISSSPAPAAPAAPAAPPEPVTPAARVEQPATPPAETPRRLGTRFWVAAGATVALTAGAIIAGSSANSGFDNLTNTCGMTTAGCTEAQIGNVESRATLANVLWLLAAGSAAATGVFVYLDSRQAGVSMALKF